jgi:hypothetical protein
LSTVDAPRKKVTLRDYQPGAVALRDTWIPIIQNRRVRKRTMRRAMHGRPVFLWRDGGRLRATEWEPGTPQEQLSAFTLPTGEYPLVERYGYAWTWYGDPANAMPELVPSVPHLPDEGLPRWFSSDVVFDCTYELVCENLLDLTHADFLHSAVTGDALSEHDEVEVHSTSETVIMTRIAHGRPLPSMQRLFTPGKSKQNLKMVTITHVRSGVCILHGDFNPGMDIRMLHPCNPESPTRCRTPVTFNPQNMPKPARLMFPRVAHVVGRQDNWALKPQNGSYIHPRPDSDLSSRFDKAGLRFRKVYQALAARQAEGDFSYLDDGHPGQDVKRELGLLERVPPAE